ncbi:cytochrome P450 3A12 [Purpureocillium lilacinum]|uniref:Cytochrome P450 3A12 n=1 Tax=Purpureocillium lilacinum TaxID=33203 RepID=A0A179GRJ3_PURLI|nr:cytochrome P450 3A12 [Purpureocillium lilacinum]
MVANIVIGLSAAALIYLLYTYILYPAFFSPLARLPTPHWSCAVSDFWILRARKKGAENRALYDAHFRHGQVVRVAPNTVSVDGVEAMRTVYQGGYEKAPWYGRFNNYGVPCMFSTLGSKEHSRRKRMISNVYSKSYIQASQPAKAQSRVILLGRLLPLLRREAANATSRGTEVQSIFMATTMDLISAYIFGIQNSTNFLEDKAYRDHWLRLYLSRHHHHFWPQEMPTLTSLCAKFGIRLYPSFVDSANAELRDWNKELCDKTREFISATPAATLPEDEPVVFKAIHAGIDKEERTEGDASLLFDTTICQRDSSVACEILDQVLAGHETAGIVLTCLAWRMSQNQDLQGQLREEILALEPSLAAGTGAACLPDARALDNLPILHAVIMETLRLHAPIPGPQPRETPYPSCTIGGYELPGGVRIAALAHTLHLDERVYPDPKRWDHTRWLTDSSTAEHHRAMNRQFWAFGSGGRMCIGSNFAWNEMKFIAAVIYANFTTAVVNDSGVEQTDGYSARPVGNQLFLKFNPL